jgi:serine/threonine protein kinase
MAMTPPDNADDEERTIVRPPSARAAGAMAPTAAIAFPASIAPTAPMPPPAAPRGASMAPGHTLPAGTRLRDYEITGLIGEGGFGIVYLAWDHSLQRKVAVKEYMPASMVSRVGGSSAIVVKSDRHLDTFKAGLKSFVNEARLLARFDHASLVKVYRFWEENGTAYMVMPFYEGPTLKTALAELGHVPSETELRAWLNPLLDALTVMHAAQCFHRDIAPDNILLTARGPLLLDFGAARRVIGDMTHALTVVLKPGYAPIEQYGDVASMTQGAWTDLYALACVVYYAITGKTPMSSVERLMDDRLEPLATVARGRYSPAFLGAIDAALAVRPQDRPQNEAQFRALLDADLPAPPRPTPPPAPPLSHEPFAGTELHSYATVPGTLLPVMATQLLARAPADSVLPADAPDSAHADSAHSDFASASGPASLASMPADSFLPSSTGVLPRTEASVRSSRGPLLVVALVIAALGLGVALFWVLQPRDGGALKSPAEAAPAVASPAPPAASAQVPAPASAVVQPPAMVPAPASATLASPAASSVVVPAIPAIAEPAARTAASAVVLPRHDIVSPAPASTPARPRREATTPHVEPPAEAKAEAPRRATNGARCSDILQKASLEPLTAEEAAYLKRECR